MMKKLLHFKTSKKIIFEKEQRYTKTLTLKGSLYKRPLPENLIPFSSKLGRELFLDSMTKGDMEQFFPLIEQFHTQNEPACNKN